VVTIFRTRLRTFYDDSAAAHRTSTWAKCSQDPDSVFNTSSGILKADGSGNISAATHGNGLSDYDSIALRRKRHGDTDTIPFYDASVAAHRKSTWINIKSVLKTYFDSLYAVASHNQGASTITAGTLAGKIQANATAAATLGNAQVRDIYTGTTDMTSGTTSLTTARCIAITKHKELIL
jgi:hypothetical protein